MTWGTARRASAFLDVLHEGDEAIALERQRQVREHRTLKRRQQRAGRAPGRAIEDERSAWGEWYTEDFGTGRVDKSPIDHRHQRSVATRGSLPRLGEAERYRRVMPESDERLHEPFEQRGIVSGKEDRCHVGAQSSITWTCAPDVEFSPHAHR